jgi:hypothetical protein
VHVNRALAILALMQPDHAVINGWSDAAPFWEKHREITLGSEDPPLRTGKERHDHEEKRNFAARHSANMTTANCGVIYSSSLPQFRVAFGTSPRNAGNRHSTR